MTTYYNLTPPPPTYVLPDNMALNPIWDQNIFMGIPLWMCVLAALFVIGVCIAIRWIYRIMHMSAVAGYREAASSTEPDATQVWHFGITGSFAIFCLTLKERVLTYQDTIKNLDKWVISSVYSKGSCGNVPMIWVRDTSEIAMDPPSEKAIVVLCKWFNQFSYDKNGNMRYEVYTDDKGKEIPVLDRKGNPIPIRIRNFMEYTHFLPRFEEKFPDGIDIPAYGFFDAGESQEFTDRRVTPKFWGARMLKLARELRMLQPDKGFFDKYGLLILVCLALIIGTGLSYAAVMS